MTAEEVKKVEKWWAMDLLHWVNYIESGGYIMPIQMVMPSYSH